MTARGAQPISFVAQAAGQLIVAAILCGACDSAETSKPEADPEAAPAAPTTKHADPEPKPVDPIPTTVESEPASKDGQVPTADAPRGLAGSVAEQVEAAREAAAETKQDPPEVAAPVEPAGNPAKPPAPAAPTEEELRAWDRKDPLSESKLHDWDRDNLDVLLGYFRDLQCYYLATDAAGTAFGDGSSTEATWQAYKRTTAKAMNTWQLSLFADNPRIIEKSRFIGHLLEAHEIALHSLMGAHNEKDTAKLAKVAALFGVVRSKVDRYVTKLGGTLPETEAADCEGRETDSGS